MSNPSAEIREGSSWRELDQTVNPRTLSAQGKKRLVGGMAQTLMFAALCTGIGWGMWEVVRALSTDRSIISDPAKSAPLREVVVITDGVLSQAWVEKTLGVRKGQHLMELDLFRLRQSLLSFGQIKSAELERNFPGTLAVTLHERLPVVRLKVQAGSSAPQVLLAARDGMVYEGCGYDPLRLAALPFLDGVRLIRHGATGFLPIKGMEDVADLMQAAENAAPQLYADWQVVSLARLQAYDEILVRARSIPEVVFSRKRDYTLQLAKLDYILGFSRKQSETALQRVDLSLGHEVPVLFEGSPALSTPSIKNPNTRNRRDL